MFGAQDALADGEQGGEGVTCGGRVPRLSCPAGEVVLDDQGVGVFGA